MRKWSIEEIKILKNLYLENRSNKEIGNVLGRTSNSVAHKLHVLDLSRPIGTNQNSFGMINPMTGKKHSPDTIRKIREKAVTRLKDKTKHPSWKGGRRLNDSGYWMVREPEHPRAVNGYVFEHILIMEQILGRYLEGEECVHHKNECSSDNEPDNLILFRNNSDHQKYHSYFRKRKVCSV